MRHLIWHHHRLTGLERDKQLQYMDEIIMCKRYCDVINVNPCNVLKGKNFRNPTYLLFGFGFFQLDIRIDKCNCVFELTVLVSFSVYRQYFKNRLNAITRTRTKGKRMSGLVKRPWKSQGGYLQNFFSKCIRFFVTVGL